MLWVHSRRRPEFYRISEATSDGSAKGKLKVTAYLKNGGALEKAASIVNPGRPETVIADLGRTGSA
jgi:hypothetical protein